MNSLKFYDLEFSINEDKILLTKFLNFESSGFEFVDVTLSGSNKDSHMGNKIDNSSEGRLFKYIKHIEKDNKLTITISSDKVLVDITFIHLFDKAYKVESNITNISNESICLEEYSTIKLVGFDKVDRSTINFTRFIQSHHYECVPNTISLDIIKDTTGASQKSIGHTNVGSWSTKDALPIGIINKDNDYLMFDISSSSSWSYEISDKLEYTYLSLGYPTMNNGGFSKILNPKEIFNSLPVHIVYGNSLNNVLNSMNNVRRLIYKPSIKDENLPVIFNEYMHLSWDSPFEERTIKLAPFIKELGAKYYVIDCGWHNEEPGCEIYPYVGQWIQSHNRFPNGIKKISDYVHSNGLLLGLWIEPEIIGYKCQDMLDYYDDDCFLKRHGKRIFVMNRYFLDFTNQKVYNYIYDSFNRMIHVYGADYIKFDYNEDIGIGSDDDSSFIEGYRKSNEAFFKLVERIKEENPNVVFEGCASGGMRMDSHTVSEFSLVSTSDQTSYLKYPYIVGNLFSAVIPEQGAVWSYPVNSYFDDFKEEFDYINEKTDVNQVIINMVNGMMGRMHLASHLELLNEEKINLIKEGINYYNKMTEVKKNCDVYLPFGFTKFFSDNVVVGINNNNKMYLAVWFMNNNSSIIIPMNCKVKSLKVGYPINLGTNVELLKDSIKVSVKDIPYATIIEIDY